MSKSLADLRAAKDRKPSLPTRIVKVCLDQDLLADIQRLTAEKRDLAVSAAVADDADEAKGGEDGGDGAPQRLVGPPPPPRLAEIDAELEPLYARLRETEGELLIRAGDGGAWLRWKDAHPAREDNAVDISLAFGYCNATDLANDLGKYVVAWNGDDFGPGEWDDWFRANVAPADIGAIVSAVVEVHEARVTAPKLRNVSSDLPTSGTDSLSPAP